MDWEDTVKNFGDLVARVQGYVERQAEISFKAGIKEVVEFIGEEPFEHNYSMYGHEVNDCFACRWQAKLKEWGIDER